jgi:hypothetical protein
LHQFFFSIGVAQTFGLVEENITVEIVDFYFVAIVPAV